MELVHTLRNTLDWEREEAHAAMRLSFEQFAYVLAHEPWRSVFAPATVEQFDAFLAQSPEERTTSPPRPDDLSPFARDLLASPPEDTLSAAEPAGDEDAAWDAILQEAAEVYYLIAAEGDNEEVIEKWRLEAAYPEEPEVFADLQPDHPPNGVSVEAFLDFLLDVQERKGKESRWAERMLAAAKRRLVPG